MQTFLYVLGPFILQAGAGLGFFALGIGAARALVKRAKASAALKHAEAQRSDDLISWSVSAGRLLADILVTSEPNALSPDQETKLTQLVTTGVKQDAIDYIDAKTALRSRRAKQRKELA